MSKVIYQKSVWILALKWGQNWVHDNKCPFSVKIPFPIARIMWHIKIIFWIFFLAILGSYRVHHRNQWPWNGANIKVSMWFSGFLNFLTWLDNLKHKNTSCKISAIWVSKLGCNDPLKWQDSKKSVFLQFFQIGPF